MKINFYTTIHKAIRRYLYIIAIEVGNYDFRDKTGFPLLHDKILKLFTLLREHAKHEEIHIRPLIEAKIKDIALKLGTEHEDQDHELKLLETRCQRLLNLSGPEAAIEGLAFYRAFNHFIAESVLHMEEEEATMSVLQDAYTSEELLEVFMRMIKSFPKDKMLQSLSYMMPALNLEERLNMLQGMLYNASLGTTNTIWANVAEALSPAGYLELKNLCN